MWPFRFAMHRKRGLRMMVVSLLSSSPKNGVEIMDGVEEMTRGWWRPTAGSIYPLLTTMVGEGTIKKRDGDGRYELTPKARKEIEYSFGRGSGSPRSSEEFIKDVSSKVELMDDLERMKPIDFESKDRELDEIAARLSALASRIRSRKKPEP